MMSRSAPVFTPTLHLSCEKVSPTHRDSVADYVRNQEEHHRSKSFQEEYREFLKRYEIDFDERYMWD